MLGVAFMAGTLVLTDTITRTFDNLFADIYRGTDAVVRAQATFEGPEVDTGDQRGRIDAALLPAVRGRTGVAAAEGSVMGYARLVGKDGEALGNPGQRRADARRRLDRRAAAQPLDLVAGQPAGRAGRDRHRPKSSRDGELPGRRHRDGARPGRRRSTVRITGIAKFGAADSPGGAVGRALHAAGRAQRLIAEPGKFDAIAVGREPGVSQDQLVSALIRPVLPAGVEAVTGAHDDQGEPERDPADAMALLRHLHAGLRRWWRSSSAPS